MSAAEHHTHTYHRHSARNDPYFQVQLTSAICTSIAILTTLFRLYIRRRTLWIDDASFLHLLQHLSNSLLYVVIQAFAFISMLFICVQLGVCVIPASAHLCINSFLKQLIDESFRRYINAYTRTYLIMFTFYATIWCARTSILFTIIRIGKGNRRKIFLYSLIGVFGVLCSLLIGQIFWVCEAQRKLKHDVCVPNKQIALSQLGSDIFADTTLLISSLQLFLIIQDKSLRHRLIYIFSTCTATTVVSLIHSALILRFAKQKGEEKVVIAALVEDSVSLIVSSLPVVANIFFQFRDRNTTGRINVSISAAHTMTNTTMPLSFKFAPSTANSTPRGSVGNLLHVDPGSSLPQLPSLPWQTPAQTPGQASAQARQLRKTASTTFSRSTTTSLSSLRRISLPLAAPNFTVVNG
ncbi:hypothetical protein CPB84DRAFT_1765704 [Gymnopilus junonius]|uniref:Uncharacterized protein n=1 Tax=Gymnopilus junonius TaxID=109634 RepID=A0A9P5TSD5_GYMJU|nr:hypothetical protein CPB84DRAFT_1765704 [Gymnopilus junonius]